MKGGESLMRIAIMTILLLISPALASPMEVTLLWSASNNRDLDHYSVYEKGGPSTLTAPWLLLAEVSKDTLTYRLTVDEGRNHDWCVVACDGSGKELRRSNTARYRLWFKAFDELRLIRQLGSH